MRRWGRGASLGYNKVMHIVGKWQDMSQIPSLSSLCNNEVPRSALSAW
jgi:hypothetical protein